MLYMVSYVVLAFILTFSVSLFLLRFVTSSRFLDVPGCFRKNHESSVPRFGGLAFSIPLFVLVAYLFKGTSFLHWCCIGMGAFVTLGLLDDLFDLEWGYKLGTQIVIGSYIFYFLYTSIPVISVFSWAVMDSVMLSYVLFMVWFLGIMNAVNLVDGLDGLAGYIVFLIYLGFLGLAYYAGNGLFMMYCLLILSALLAFLWFNKAPAKYFMGDSGSLFLGFQVACAPMIFFLTSGSGMMLDMTPFILFCLYLIMDTMRVFGLRLWRQKHPFKPDRLHMHFSLLDLTGSYSFSVFSILCYVAVTIMMGLVSVGGLGVDRMVYFYGTVLVFCLGLVIRGVVARVYRRKRVGGRVSC